MKQTDHKMHENCISCLIRLVSPGVYNTMVVENASLYTQFLSDKVITCKITLAIKIKFKFQSNANSERWINPTE